MLLSGLADICQLALNDSGAAIWSQQTVQEWVLEGIRDYSNHCQRTSIEYYATDAYTYTFNAPLACLDVVTLSRETDEEGFYQYLTRYNHQDPRFYEEDDYYDWLPSHDRFYSGVIHLSKATVPGDVLQLTYKSLYYVYEFAGADPEILVADEDLPIIVQYVVWRALTERFLHILSLNPPSGGSSADPDHWGNRLGDLRQAIELARDHYTASLTAAVQARKV
jgi:hypothetical protein